MHAQQGYLDMRTHVAILVAVGVLVMVSFSFVAHSTLAITAPIERLCDNNK